MVSESHLLFGSSWKRGHSRKVKVKEVKVRTPSAQASLLYQVLNRQMFMYAVFSFMYAVFSCRTPSCVSISS